MSVKRFTALLSIMVLQFAATMQSGCTTRSQPPAPQDEFTMIVDRYRSLLVASPGQLQRAAVPNPADAPQWVETLGEDGRWPDIDYTDRSGGAWLTANHLRRVRILAKALLDAQSSLFQDRDTEKVILRAVAHWNEQRYQNPNWWQNEIGVPQLMRDIIVLLGDRLTGATREGAFVVLHQYFVRPAKEGANTVWSAELALMAAALEKNPELLTRASALIAGEIVIGAEQGIQVDYSFHQHGARLQQFHYGGSFFSDTVRLAWLLRGTPWAFPSNRAVLLADYAEQGNTWMSRGIATVPGTLDRAVSRPGALGWADTRAELAMLADILPDRAVSFAALRQHQDGKGAPPTGFRSFPRSDFSTHHRPAFSFFLKTISTRTEVTETILRENKKGRKLNWGDHYLITQNSDYVDLPPVWDWDLLPGVTSSITTDSIQRQTFVGAVGDGKSGASVMDYQVGREGVTTLTARKFWASNEDVVVGLIGNLRSTAPGEPVRTALEQRRLKGVVTVADAAGIAVLAEGNHQRRGVRWIHHDGLLYIPLGAEPVTLKIGPVTGAWHGINLNYSDDPITIPLFLPVLEHGSAPAGESGGFAIMACAAAEQAPALVASPAWKILRNDAAGQAVSFADGTITAAFYEPGKISPGEGNEIEVDQACLVLLSRDEVRVCDPTQQGRAVSVRIGERTFKLICPPGGKTSVPLGR